MNEKLTKTEEYETTVRLEQIFERVVPYHNLGFLVYDCQKSGFFAKDGSTILLPLEYKHIYITERFPYGDYAEVTAVKEDGSETKLKIEY